jgi:glyoxylate reductase
MAKPKVFITRKILDTGSQLIQQYCDADIWQKELHPSHEVLLGRVQGIQGLLSLLTDTIDAEVMDSAGRDLKVISNHAVGTDNIDVEAATLRGIVVGNTPGILTDATADFTFTLLLSAARRVIEADRYVRAGKWKTWGPGLMLGSDITGSTLGIIGFGRIGQAVARRAAGFDMKILFYDPNQIKVKPGLDVHPVELDFLLQNSDFISIHTPLTPQTRHLIDQTAFEKMRSNAILINTARGAIVDPTALYHALKYYKIRAAALDVTDPEPIQVGNPLLELENLIICPHIASASHSTRERMSIMAAENLIAGLKGEELPNCVNPEIYH